MWAIEAQSHWGIGGVGKTCLMVAHAGVFILRQTAVGACIKKQQVCRGRPNAKEI